MKLMPNRWRDSEGPEVAARVELALQRCVQWSHQGRHRRVLAEVERLLEVVERDSRLASQLMIWKAQALLAMGHAERALPAASAAWHIECSPPACHLMASALDALGEADQAERLLRTGCELFGGAVHLSMQLAMLLAEQRRAPEALEVLERVAPDCQLPEDLQEFLVGLRAHLLASLDRWTEAQAVLQDGLDRHPGSPVLAETRAALARDRSRRKAEVGLAQSWRSSIDPLTGSAAEVDEAVVRCAALLELSELVALAARRLWRAFLATVEVRPLAPDPWAAAMVVAVLELDGRRPSVAAVAQTMAVSPATVRSALRRVRGFLGGQDRSLARRAFGALSNPRLGGVEAATGAIATVVRFPGP
jgi:hypothetical protein